MHIKKIKTSDILNAWLPLALIITGFSGLIYGTSQQNIRTSANDPQIQMAQDLKISLENGVQPTLLTPTTKVDLAISLSPFIIIYDNKGQVTATNAILNNQVPVLPSGIFDYINNHGEDRLTWQPKVGVRVAADVISYKGQTDGFILVGRSLKEVEIREDQLLRRVMIGWLIILFGSLALIIFLNQINPRSNS